MSWKERRGQRAAAAEAHSDSLTNVPWLREMAATSDLGKGKELGSEGGRQVKWRHGVKISLSRSHSLGQWFSTLLMP